MASGINLKPGDKFRLFRKGVKCVVIAIENGKVKFETDSEVPMSGSVPIGQINDHLRIKE